MPRAHVEVVAAVSVGGALGALARHGLAVALPSGPGEWPWATFLTNGLGCLAIGVLMVVVLELTAAHRLVRPFLGPGLLGGFTTFSTYALETRALVADGHGGLAAAYVVASVLVGLLAVWLGARTARGLWRRVAVRVAGEEVRDEAHRYGAAADHLSR